MPVHDASEAIKAKVKAKVEDSKLPKQIKGAVANTAGKLASKKVKPSMMAGKMAKKLENKLPPEMKKKGLTVSLESVFEEANYFVLELNVLHVDSVAIEKNMREASADVTKDDDQTSLVGTMLQWSLSLMGQDNQRKLEEDFLPAKVQAKLGEQMMAVMEEKFEDMKLKAEVQILKEEKQARYFYSKIRGIRAAAAEERNAGPLKEFRRKFSGDDEDDL